MSAVEAMRQPKVRKVISFINPKGGAGKSTVCQNLSTAASYDGYDVCMVDFDEQRHMEKWSLRRRKVPTLPQVTVYASGLTQHSTAFSRSYGHEMVFIDTPGNVADNIEALAAIIKMSDFIVCPVQLSQNDFDTATPWVKEVGRVKGEKVGFVMNRVDMRTPSEILNGSSYLMRFGRVCGNPIRDLVSFKRVLPTGRSVIDSNFAEDAKAKQDITAVWNWLEMELGI